MKRTVIKINEGACVGCGLCVNACHESAIVLIDGKAKLLRDDYCDGLGNCLPVCPTGAISFEEREALPFDKEAVLKNQAKKKIENEKAFAGGCPGSRTMTLSNSMNVAPVNEPVELKSQLRQWPVQIKLIPVNAPYFEQANLLIAADCTAFAYNNFHNKFINNHVTIIGCPKLDEGDYSEKLTEILKYNNIKKVTIVRMEVPCCGGLSHAAIEALKNCGKMIPWQVITISVDGEILED